MHATSISNASYASYIGIVIHYDASAVSFSATHMSDSIHILSALIYSPCSYLILYLLSALFALIRSDLFGLILLLLSNLFNLTQSTHI